MKIIFANQKGGVGKTTLSILLANYLALEKKEEVIILDMDDQRTVFDKWNTDGRDHDAEVYSTLVEALSDYPDIQKLSSEVKTLEHLKGVLKSNSKINPGLKVYLDNAEKYSWEESQLYPVLSKNLDEYPEIKPMLDRAKEANIIIDLPGRMDDDDLVPIYQDANLVICPTRYDEFTMLSTFTFAQVIRQINPNVPIVFIPNRVKPNVKYELKSQIHDKLKNFGTVLSELPDRVSLERLNTYSLPVDVKTLLSVIYDNLYDNFLAK